MDEGRRLLGEATTAANRVTSYLTDSGKGQIEQEIDQLKTMWQEINALSSSVGERLNLQQTKWHRYTEQLATVKTWLSDTERQLGMQTTDMTDKKTKLDRLKVCSIFYHCIRNSLVCNGYLRNLASC